MIRIAKLVGVLLLASSGVALAQTAPAPAPQATPAPAAQPAPTDAAVAKFRQACAADVQKFCATAEKGRGKMRACLDSHATELSAGCQTARAERASLKK